MISANSIFRQFIENHEPAMPLLPAVHTTWGAKVITILATNRLMLKPCDNYKMDLVYLFYGKPVYKLVRDGNPTTIVRSDAAVCFVLNTDKLPKAHRIFALDTGAWFKNRYNEFLGGQLSINDFEMETDCNSAAKLVTAFFGQNQEYVLGRSKSEITIRGLDVVSDTYKAIASAAASGNFDERACTCELQYAVELELDEASVRTVIMPDIFSGDELVQNTLDEWNIKPITYEWVRAKPEERTIEIYAKLREYYRANGFMR